MGTNTDERTLGEMFAELSRETRTLIQQELELAKTELTEKASAMGKGAAFIVGGGLIAYAGLLAIVAAFALVLIAVGLPPWAATFVGGLLVAGAGYLLVRSGFAALKPQHLAPRQTIETLKEDAQWVKAQTK
jgi:Putative Actinobacterial Holin-X, holin superfamily III